MQLKAKRTSKADYIFLPSFTSTQNLYRAIFKTLPENDLSKDAFSELESLLCKANTDKTRILQRYYGIGRSREDYFEIANSLGLEVKKIKSCLMGSLRRLRASYYAKAIQFLFLTPKDLRTEILRLRRQIRELEEERRTLISESSRSFVAAKKPIYVDDLRLSTKIVNALKNAYILRVDELIRLSRADLLSAPRTDIVSVREIEDRLGTFGLSLLDDM